MKKHQIITVPIDDCYPNAYNANRMSEKKFESLVDTIRRSGQTHPIQAIKDNKGKYRIVGGEHKWRAMKALKYNEVELIIREFEDEVEEKLGSLEDNIHGESIPIKEALIIASANKKYPLPKLMKRLGEDESDLRDKLLLVSDEDKVKKLTEQMEQEHIVDIDFVVDIDPKKNADRFIQEISKVAKQFGARVVNSHFKRSKSKEAVSVLSFVISEKQRAVIDMAIENVRKSEQVAKGTALEYLSADYLAGAKLSPKVTEKRPNKKVK